MRVTSRGQKWKTYQQRFRCGVWREVFHFLRSKCHSKESASFRLDQKKASLARATSLHFWQELKYRCPGQQTIAAIFLILIAKARDRSGLFCGNGEYTGPVVRLGVSRVNRPCGRNTFEATKRASRRASGEIVLMSGLYRVFLSF